MANVKFLEVSKDLKQKFTYLTPGISFNGFVLKNK